MTSSRKLPRFIAVTGQEGSGKDTYARHLAGMGYLHISAGDFIREEARSRGHSDPLSREILSRIGDQLKAEFGPSPITEASIKRFERQESDFPAGLVISGFRRLGELEAFKKHGAIALWIAADEKTRYRNLGYRQDRPTWEEFIERSDKEYEGGTGGGKDGVNLHSVESQADCMIVNDSDMETLLRRGDEALAVAVDNS